MKHSRILLLVIISITSVFLIYIKTRTGGFSSRRISKDYSVKNKQRSSIFGSDPFLKNTTSKISAVNYTKNGIASDNRIFNIEEADATNFNYTRKPKSSLKFLNFNGYTPILGQQELNLHCSTCSLVSSSGHLLHSKAGKEIDSADCVIRMNDAPVVHFEEDVGTKTTLRFVAHSSVHLLIRQEKSLLNGPSAPQYVIVWGPLVNMKTDGKGKIYNAAKAAALKNKNIHFFMLSPSQMDYADQVFFNETGELRQKSGVWLSTGFFTMIYMINICDSINVFGMVDKDHCHNHHKENIPYHYYNNKIKECHYYNSFEKMKHSKHLFALEKELFGLWSQIYSIKFYHPHWEYKD